MQCNYRVSRAPLLSYLLLLGLEPHEWTPLFPFLHSKHQITISNRFALSLFGALYLCTSHTPRTASSFSLLYLQLLSVMESETFSDFIDLLKRMTFGVFAFICPLSKCYSFTVAKINLGARLST